MASNVPSFMQEVLICCVYYASNQSRPPILPLLSIACRIDEHICGSCTIVEPRSDLMTTPLFRNHGCP
eukprot:scaffold25_cov342-Pavlova_lutheri.AAC.42